MNRPLLYFIRSYPSYIAHSDSFDSRCYRENIVRHANNAALAPLHIGDFIELLERGYIALVAVYVLLDFDGIEDAVAFDKQIDFVAVSIAEEIKVHVGRDAIRICP